jgi:hypothetical protein
LVNHPPDDLIAPLKRLKEGFHLIHETARSPSSTTSSGPTEN